MKSPIARGLRAASRLAEWAHRRIHGPKYAPGDVVETGRGLFELCFRDDDDEEGAWWAEQDKVIREDEIIRVVRYGEGE